MFCLSKTYEFCSNVIKTVLFAFNNEMNRCVKKEVSMFYTDKSVLVTRPSVTISNLAPVAGPRLDRDTLPITLLLPPTCSSPQMQNTIITITITVVKTYNLPSHQKFHFLMEVSISSGFIILSHHWWQGSRLDNL